MTKAANCFLLYLDRYLTEKPERRKELERLHLKLTGRAVEYSPNIWRHVKRKIEPSLSTALVYQIFLHQAGELIPAKEPGALFHYKRPAWLKARP